MIWFYPVKSIYEMLSSIGNLIGGIWMCDVYLLLSSVFQKTIGRIIVYLEIDGPGFNLIHDMELLYRLIHVGDST